MKTLKMLVLALLAMAAVINNTQAAEATVSPNGFNSPECTYGADLLTSSYGWTLKFSSSYGRDAYLWPSLITNGKTTSSPQANDLIVLDAWSGSAVGHVGWVYGRYDGWILVIHTNMKVGTDWFSYGGATFRYAWFYDLSNGSVYCWDNGNTYSLKAFNDPCRLSRPRKKEAVRLPSFCFWWERRSGSTHIFLRFAFIFQRT